MKSCSYIQEEAAGLAIAQRLLRHCFSLFPNFRGCVQTPQPTASWAGIGLLSLGTVDDELGRSCRTGYSSAVTSTELQSDSDHSGLCPDATANRESCSYIQEEAAGLAIAQRLLRQSFSLIPTIRGCVQTPQPTASASGQDGARSKKRPEEKLRGAPCNFVLWVLSGKLVNTGASNQVHS
ncbi:hypothetical protein ACRRTK_020597 [Alexandromys fortis]